MRKLSLPELSRLSVEEYRIAEKFPVVIVLDNLRSRYNIGSVFRTADAFRAQALYLCGITATPPCREINKTALGATESVEWRHFETTLHAVSHLRSSSFKIFAIEQTENSISLDRLVFPEANQKIALIIGNEVFGVDQAIVDVCDCVIEIPQFGTKHSLNVAVSTGIVMWQIINLLLTNKY